MDVIIEKIKTKKEEIKLLYRVLFKEGVDYLFNKYTWLYGFQWNQGTPGFCDGDPCYFLVRNDFGEGLVLWSTIDWDQSDEKEPFYEDAYGNEYQPFSAEGSTIQLSLDGTQDIKEGITVYPVCDDSTYIRSWTLDSWDNDRYGYREKYITRPVQTEKDQAIDDIAKFLDSLSEDVLVNSFGDPVEVCLYRTGEVKTDYWDIGY